MSKHVARYRETISFVGKKKSVSEVFFLDFKTTKKKETAIFSPLQFAVEEIGKKMRTKMETRSVVVRDDHDRATHRYRLIHIEIYNAQFAK